MGTYEYAYEALNFVDAFVRLEKYARTFSEFGPNNVPLEMVEDLATVSY